MKYQDYIANVVRHLQGTMMLQEYNFRITFDEDLGAPDDPDNLEIRADIAVQTEYLRARIRCGKPMRRLFKDGKYRDIWETLCHELAHVIIEPISEIAMEATAPVSHRLVRQIEERQVQRICNVIMGLLPSRLFRF